MRQVNWEVGESKLTSGLKTYQVFNVSITCTPICALKIYMQAWNSSINWQNTPSSTILGMCENIIHYFKMTLDKQLKIQL